MRYIAHIEWLECDCGARRHGILRLFEDRGQKLADDGMPDGAWLWRCHVELRTPVLKFRAARHTPPDGSRHLLYEVARSLGCERVWWQRCVSGRLVTVEFPIPSLAA
jgi:hypothetical protein